MTPSTAARLSLVALGVLSLALPLGVARAEHCDKRMVVFSGRNVGSNPNLGFFGCLLGDEEANSDLIMPGATALSVRWLEAAEPVGSATLTFSGITGPARTCTPGASCTLKFTQGTDFTGAPGDFWDSQTINISSSSSLTGGQVVVRVCQDLANTDCDTRTYRTVAS